MSILAVIIFLGLCTLFLFGLKTEEEKEWHKFRSIFFNRSAQEATAWFHNIETRDLEHYHYTSVMMEYKEEISRLANSEIYNKLSLLQSLNHD